MKKPSPVGIKILGISIVASNLLFLSLALNPKSYFELFVRPFGAILFTLSIVFTLFEVILGINILLLKDWARKYIVALNIAYLGFLFLTPFIQSNDSLLLYEQNFKQRVQQVSMRQQIIFQQPVMQRKGLARGINTPQESMPVSLQPIISDNVVRLAIIEAMALVYMFFLFWYLLIIFFFTRPKVKGQFN
jgi:hypothetical protein